MAKVSVIIPCYNQGRYINETIASVEAQTFTDWEIVIVNDGSDEPETQKIIADFQGKKLRVIHTENMGVAAARNTGIKAAKGEYILPLDADDLIGVNYLKEAVVFLDTNAEVKVVYCNGEYFQDQIGLIQLPDYDSKIMLQQNLIFCTAMYRKSDWVTCGGYDENFKTGWEDWEFWLRMIKNDSEVYKLSPVHFYYRIKKVSRNAIIQNQRLQEVEQQLYCRHFEMYKTFYPKPITILRDYEDLCKEREQYEKYKNELQGSFSYKTGNFLLMPFKVFRRFFNKSFL